MYNNFRFLIFLIILGIFCGCQNNTNYKIPINIESIDDEIRVLNGYGYSFFLIITKIIQLNMVKA